MIWKCPFRVDVLLWTDACKCSNCLVFALTWDMSWEQLKTMVTCVSTQLCFCPVLKVCSSHLEKHSLPVPSWMQLRANTLESWCDFFYPCMCLSSDSTTALKSSQLIAGAEKPLPCFWHIYSSPTFASLEPSFSCSQNPIHKRLLFHSSFLHTSGPVFLPHCIGSPKMAICLRWSGLNTSLKHSPFEPVPVRKANTPGHYINQKGDQEVWASFFPGQTFTGPTFTGRERGEGGAWPAPRLELAPFPNLQLRAGLIITYVYKRTRPSPITKFQTVPLARCHYASNTWGATDFISFYESTGPSVALLPTLILHPGNAVSNTWKIGASKMK